MITKYLLGSYARCFLSGCASEDGGETWQYYDPLIIVGMIVGRKMLEGAEHTEVELGDSSVELTVWWRDE